VTNETLGNNINKKLNVYKKKNAPIFRLECIFVVIDLKIIMKSNVQFKLITTLLERKLVTFPWTPLNPGGRWCIVLTHMAFPCQVKNLNTQ
jgi:hypothetical protein